MKNLHSLINTSIIVGLWVGALLLIAGYRLEKYGVNPQFPYYNIIITKVQRPLEAIGAYFDGAHYVRLAEYGYVDVGTQAFFPVYPLLLRSVTGITHLPIIFVGQMLSLLFLVGALVCLELLFGHKAKSSIAWLLIFPTSFFFFLVYTESMFLFETMLFFLLLKRKEYWWAAMVAGVASATRLVGSFLALALIVEFVQYYRLPANRSQASLWRMFAMIVLSVSGFIAYSYFLYVRFGDPLMYLHVQSMFGAERSSGQIIVLPQVLFRYAKMLLSVDKASFIYQRVVLELVIFLSACAVWIRNIKKIPPSWSAYVGASLILPTLTGTLSSMPRYVLVLIPFLIGKDKSLWNLPRAILFLVSTWLLAYMYWTFVGGTFIA